jgi:phosphoglycolate phosphatase-like HAD superfamily hydrolase
VQVRNMNQKTVGFTKADLTGLKPGHATFVGIDSDGCIFPTMELKQKNCFHPRIVAHWQLAPIEKQVRETAEFVNLYSRHRGQNRFTALALTFELLRDRSEVKAAGIKLPELKSLKKFIASGLPLGNPALAKLARETGDAELAAVLAWSEDVNQAIEKTVTNVPPYRWVLESLQKIKANSDAICVSQTPAAALVREWRQHGLLEYVRVIAGQELGTKAEHLRLATAGRYPSDRVLMIGDALGDLQAARENQASFYPINPGKEVESWERFCKVAYDKFLRREYGGGYEGKLIADFEQLLPENPPWKTIAGLRQNIEHPTSNVQHRS